MDSLLHSLLLLAGLLQGGSPEVPEAPDAPGAQETRKQGAEAPSVPSPKTPAERPALEPRERAGLLAAELALDLVQRSRVREIIAMHEHGQIFRRKGAARAAAGQRGKAGAGKPVAGKAAAKKRAGGKRASSGGKRASKGRGKKARGGGKARRKGASPPTGAAKGAPRPRKAPPDAVPAGDGAAETGVKPTHESLEGLDARALTEILGILEKEQVGRYLEILGSQGLEQVRQLASQRRKALAGFGERAGGRRRGEDEDDDFSLFGDEEGGNRGGRGRGRRGGRGGRSGRGGSGDRQGFF